MIWLFGFFFFFLSWGLTGLVRYYALAYSILDIPNGRSSHLQPIPRGGGLAFVLAFLGVNFLGWQLNFLPSFYFNILFFPGLAIALLGLIDDKVNVSGFLRLFFQFILVGVILWQIGGIPPISLGFLQLPEVWLNGLASIAFVWLINLYNFMDGIDGLSSLEAISVCLSLAILLWSTSASLAFLNMLLAIAVAGFLCWNFPKAKIFMGDVGSYFLGLVLGIFILLATKLNANFLWVGFILLGVFIVDATFTLLIRVVKKERVFEAHCNHAYQRASRYYQSHAKVSLMIFLFNLFWLLPWAWIVSRGILEGKVGLIIAYLPIICIFCRLKKVKLDNYTR